MFISTANSRFSFTSTCFDKTWDTFWQTLYAARLPGIFWKNLSELATKDFTATCNIFRIFYANVKGIF